MSIFDVILRIVQLYESWWKRYDFEADMLHDELFF